MQYECCDFATLGIYQFLWLWSTKATNFQSLTRHGMVNPIAGSYPQCILQLGNELVAMSSIQKILKIENQLNFDLVFPSIGISHVHMSRALYKKKKVNDRSNV